MPANIFDYHIIEEYMNDGLWYSIIHMEETVESFRDREDAEAYRCFLEEN